MAGLAGEAEAATRAVNELQRAIDGLHGKDVRVGVDVAGAGLGRAAAGAGGAAAAAQAARETASADREVVQASSEVAAAEAAAAAATKYLSDAYANAAVKAQLLAIAAKVSGDAAAAAAAKEMAAAAVVQAAAAADSQYAFKAQMAAVGARVHAAAADSVTAAVAREAAATDAVTAASVPLRAALDSTARAADNAGAAANRAWRPWWLFGQNWLTAIHWIVAGSAELAAVVIPALVALGAGALVAVQGAQNVQRHFTALYAATESTASAFHTTMGDVLGLGHALQTAQNAANPGVYEILGSVINDAKSKFADFAGTGLQVVHMLDEFSARITVDLKGALGGQLSAFLAGMVTDLQQLGQVLGNFGHALVNVFAAMPGLVHVLLALLDGVSKFVLFLSRAPTGLLTFAIAIEEVFRWGGLLLGLLVRLAGAIGFTTAFAAGTGFITKFGAALINLVGVGGQVIQWAGTMIGRFGAIDGAAASAGMAIEGFGADVQVAAAEMSAGFVAAIVAGVAALGFLTFKILTAKSATEKWIAASDKMVAAASGLNVLPTIYNQLALTTTRLSNAQQKLGTMTEYSNKANGNSIITGMKAQEAYFAQSKGTQDLANHLITLVHTADTVRSNINYLAGAFHLSAAGALALASAAGVNLQQGLLKGTMAGRIAVQMINNLKTGLGAMSAPMGVIGADMEAVGVQSQLAASKVQTVNQALDQLIATTTGGMSTLAQFESALHSMGNDTAATSVRINGSISSISRSAAAMGYTLQGMGPKAQQSWQQFAQAVQQGQQVLDTMRIGMAENVVSAGQYNTAIRTVAGSLLPFAAHSKTAVAIVSQLAQEAGFPATTSLKTLAQQLGVTGAKAKGELVRGVEAAIARMANLNQVARNLSATVATQLDSAMAGAIVKASGLDQAYLKWAYDVKNNASAATLAKDYNAITQAQNFVAATQIRATKVLNQNTTAMTKNATAAQVSATKTRELAPILAHTAQAVLQHAKAADQATTAQSAMSAKTSAANAVLRALGTQVGTATTGVKNLGKSADTTRGSLGTINNEIQKTATFAGNARGPLGTMSNEISNIGKVAGAAAGQVAALARAISGLQSKTVTLTVNTVHTGAGSGVGLIGGGAIPGGQAHAAMGTLSARAGPLLVGEHGPELLYARGGEQVVPAPQTAGIMAMASEAAAGSSTPVEMHVHSHAYLDGKEIFNSVRVESYKFSTRNSGSRTGLLIPGNQIGKA